ncbi:MAG: T9SS type A sorting domain-containing protein [Chloroflexota bacterium]
MKKILSALLFMIGFATIAYAQPSLPSCPNSVECTPVDVPWGLPKSATVILPPGNCPGCTIEIQWWSRECGNGIQIKMGSVSVEDGDCSACMSWIPSFAARYALKNDPIILSNFIGWTEGQTICVRSIKLSRFSCFRWVPGKAGESGPYPGWSHMEQCAPDLTGCCEYTVEVCKTWEGTINDAIYIDSEPIGCEEGCQNNCTFNDGEVWLKQGVASPDTKEFNLGESFEITPNPNDGNAHLKMAVKEKGAYTLTITDLRGNPVFETILKLGRNTYESDLKLNSLAAGPYLYKVTIGNKTCFNGKINIIK